MRPIVDPPSARLHELAGADRRRMADDGDHITLPRALTLRTQKPVSSLWKVTRSTRLGDSHAHYPRNMPAMGNRTTV